MRARPSTVRAPWSTKSSQTKLAYAITTGVGKLSDVRIAGDQIRELQVNLVRSHAVGVGEPLPAAETRAMMLLRANSLAKGYSGVRAVVIDTLCEMLNRGVTPFVPSQGSVGASGDLAPLAHLALALIGEGECVDSKGARIPSADALKQAQIKPLVLEAKEAISLINGTQGMLAVGTLALLAAETLVDSADVLGGLCCDACKAPTPLSTNASIKCVRTAARSKTAANLRKMLEGSQIRESHRDCGRVQDAYSLRCIPQVHGAVRDTLAHCRQVFETEANSADRQSSGLHQPTPSGWLRRRCNLRRKFSRRASSLRSGFPRHRPQRPGRHQRAPHRAPGESRAQRRFAAVSRARRRIELRLHDAAGHGGRAGQREQSAGASRVGRFDHHLGQ
jgi:histidine ammonia-lyase